MGDFDRRYRDDLRYSDADYDGGRRPYDGGYRNEFPGYGAGAGADGRSLERVKGNVPSSRRRSPNPPFAPPRRGVSSSSRSSAWCFGDPEMKRRRRVARYKAYAVEGKVKSSIRKGFRWIKIKCSELIHGR
ncbi:hypothetical protein C4D60_Mb08t09840 [Musa balbisiana]|uniref:DUF3511 domain-containing protein n=1 Tax=Musa balbisiana TaxID=52838 RepID=A0A4S8K2M5_MUSBA|nr:hypothetical protein C4D60_Mb08t09840 [Musa balbisiana]